MTPDTSTTVKPRSLADFEDDSADDIPVLPRRPRERSDRPATGPDQEAGEKGAGARGATAETSDGPSGEQAEDVPAPARKSPSRRSRQKPAEESATTHSRPKTPSDEGRASNVNVPAYLADLLAAKAAETGMFHGELIIAAIEATGDRLEELLRPKATVGGRFFEARPSRRAAEDETDQKLKTHKTAVNYRMREKDFAAMDQLVEQLGARSRNQLIVAALKGYLTD